MTSEADNLTWSDRLSNLDTGLVSDVLDEAGLPNRALHRNIIPVGAGQKIAGPALCVRGERIVRSRHPRESMPAADLENHVFHGSILVLSSGQMTEAAPVGGIVCRSLLNHGCKGIITDAAVRDRDELETVGLPVYAGGASPVNAARIWHFTEIDAPIEMPSADGGTTPVRPGDYLVADGDGIVVLPQANLRQIIEDAERLKEIEAEIVAAIEGGMTRAEAFVRHPRFEHVRQAGASRKN